MFQPLSGNAINPDDEEFAAEFAADRFNPSQETPLTQTMTSTRTVGVEPKFQPLSGNAINPDLGVQGIEVDPCSQFQPLSGNAINPDPDGIWVLLVGTQCFNPSQETPLTQTFAAPAQQTTPELFQPLSGNAINPDLIL